MSNDARALLACSHCGAQVCRPEDVVRGVAPACDDCLDGPLTAGSCLVCLAPGAPVEGHAFGVPACADCIGMANNFARQQAALRTSVSR